MKKTLISLALLASFAASAQDSQSTSQSGSLSGANSTAGAAAIGNVNASQSNSGSASRADSGSVSGALGNVIYLDQSGPTSQTVNATTTSRAEQILNGHTTEDINVQNSGTTRQEVVNSGTVNTNVHYSGTQTLKNVPGIAMSGPASGPCTGASGGLGLAGPGWGLGLNGSAVMADCRLRENARVLGMGMQSLDGAANPQEKGELTVLFMDSMRALAAYNRQIAAEEIKPVEKK
jgi:hypothetical protein